MSESTGIQYQSKSTGEWQDEPILLHDLWNIKIDGQMFIRPNFSEDAPEIFEGTRDALNKLTLQSP